MKKVYIYQSHLTEKFYISLKEVTTSCKACGDYDKFIGRAERKDAEDFITHYNSLTK